MHSETSKTVAVIIGLMISAILPAAALTVKNTSAKEQTIAVDTGSVEKVYKVPAAASVDVKEDCSKGCAVTGPWGYSKSVASNSDVIATNGISDVTVAAAPAPAPVKAAAAEPAPAKAVASTEAPVKSAAAATSAESKSKAKVAKAKSKTSKSASAKVKAKAHHAKAHGKHQPKPGTFAALFGDASIPL